MKILIVDDLPTKIQELTHILSEKINFTLEVDVANSVFSAKKKLRERKYDLVVLDINLPIRDGGEPRVEGGLRVLDDTMDPGLQMPTFVIGLTSYDNFKEQVSKEFQDKCWGIVSYRADSNDWANIIVDKIQHLSELRNNNARVFDFDLAILTAVKVEYSIAKDVLAKEWVNFPVTGDPTIYSVADVIIPGSDKKIKTVIAMCPEMGPASASMMTSKIINAFNPRRLVMVGIAGGVEGEVEIGDVVVADPCWDISAGKLIRTPEGKRVQLPDPRHLRISAESKASWDHIAANPSVLNSYWVNCKYSRVKKSPVIHVGLMGAGGLVITDAEYISEVKTHARKLLAVDMESYGVMLAAEHIREPKPDFFVVKSICDYANSVKNDDYQSFCAYMSVAALLEFLKFSMAVGR